MRARRGDLFWADHGPVLGHEQGGRRPVLVLSHEVFNASHGVAIVASVTGKPSRGTFPLSHPLASGGLAKASWAMSWQIRTVSVHRMGRRIGHVDEAEVDRVVEGLMEIVGG